MMVGMMAFGWLFMRGRSGSHGGHGMMMCHMGHDAGNGHESHDQTTSTEPADLVTELKAQRERLDQLIARAEEKSAR
jgi:hypothetical protein